MTRHLALVGPTATGKTDVALAVARLVGAVEIVSLDSMQVYREMDIGTAKASAAERAEVPHHLVDVADPSEEWSVKRTQQGALDAIGDIESRGHRAVLVGGTGLYVRAVVDALDIPGGDPTVRAELDDATSTAHGLADAYARLQHADPRAAARIEPDNRRRIVRALEVLVVTGRPFSSFGPGLETYAPPAIDVRLVGITVGRDELAMRIAARVADMCEKGLLDEVRALSARARGLSQTAGQAIGYKELLAFLGGDGSLDDALDLTVRRTRQFARRQRVWFERDPRVAWVDGSGAKSAAVAEAVLATWSPAVTTNSP